MNGRQEVSTVAVNDSKRLAVLAEWVSLISGMQQVEAAVLTRSKSRRHLMHMKVIQSSDNRPMIHSTAIKSLLSCLCIHLLKCNPVSGSQLRDDSRSQGLVSQ